MRGPLAVVLLCACGSSRPPEAPREILPYPEKAPSDMAPELGWRYGGCPWELAGTAFGDLPLDGPIGPVKDATLACRVTVLKPENASRPTGLGSDRDDAPDVLLGASFGAGPTMTRRGPDDSREAWFAFAPVTLAAGDRVAFMAEDHDTVSDNDLLGDVHGSFAPDQPLTLTSDAVRVACVPVSPERLQRVTQPLIDAVDQQLARFDAAEPSAEPPSFDRPAAADDARRNAKCLAAFAEPSTARAVVARVGASELRWRERVALRLEAVAKQAVVAKELSDTPFGFTIGEPVCGHARLPDDPSWGSSSRDEALPGTAWCLVPVTLLNNGTTPAKVALITSPTRPEHADTLGFLAWSAMAGPGASEVCSPQSHDATLAPGERATANVACAVPTDQRLRVLRVHYRFGSGPKREGTFALD